MYLRKNDIPVLYEGFVDSGINSTISMRNLFILFVAFFVSCLLIYFFCKKKKGKIY